jgi:hypothetical protein
MAILNFSCSQKGPFGPSMGLDMESDDLAWSAQLLRSVVFEQLKLPAFHTRRGGSHNCF